VKADRQTIASAKTFPSAYTENQHSEKLPNDFPVPIANRPSTPEPSPNDKADRHSNDEEFAPPNHPLAPALLAANDPKQSAQ
jgi:hypothetical protein